MVKVAGEKLEERLEDHVKFNREGHEFRYRLASGFATKDDTVVDAACGTGYGRQFFDCHEYVGVDRVDRFRPTDAVTWSFHCSDLTMWEPMFAFDVAVSFETIEHLTDYHHFVEQLKRARKFIVASVPIVPTVGNNPYHFHDFAPGSLAGLIIRGDNRWRLYEHILQPSEESEIVVLQRQT